MDRSKKEVLTALFDKKIINVLHFLINHPKESFLKEIAESTGVPPASALRILHHLHNHELISVKKVGRTSLYRWESTQDSTFLSDLLAEKRNPLAPFIEMCAQDDAIERVVLHGSMKPEKTNVLIIGKGVNNDALQKCAMQIKSECGVTISHMCLDKKQYEQMTGMGLYSGKKTVLYEP